MPNQILKGSAAAAGVALINSIANLAGFGAPWLIGEIKTSTGDLSYGFLIVAVVEAFGFLLLAQRVGAPGRVARKRA
jgi:hypothetical protein